MDQLWGGGERAESGSSPGFLVWATGETVMTWIEMGKTALGVKNILLCRKWAELKGCGFMGGNVLDYGEETDIVVILIRWTWVNLKQFYLEGSSFQYINSPDKLSLIMEGRKRVGGNADLVIYPLVCKFHEGRDYGSFVHHYTPALCIILGT